jgi:hypothetical protein
VEILGISVDLREDWVMAAEIHKKLAIQISAYAREAERSVDFACMGPDQWIGLQGYYGPAKLAALRDIVDQLKPFMPSYPPLMDRRQFGKGSFAWLLRRPFIRMANLNKMKWRFSRDEIVFIHQTFQCLLEMLLLQPTPPAVVLVNMRTDLYMCECLIHRRLCGIPDIEKATRVEHFCQPSHLVHIRIEDLLESQQAGGDRNDLRARKASGRLTEGPTNRVA